MNLAYAMTKNDEGPRPAGASARQLTQWLQPRDIVLDVDVWDRRRALELAATRIGDSHGLGPAPILRALWRREQIGSTAIGQGVAIPHARIAGITRPLTLFMRPRIAMAFDAPDGKPVSNLLVIMVPADGATEDHLELLALVAEAFSDPAFRSRLSAASNVREVAAVFDQWAEHRPA
jgi:PTS system nitrogen regulatory IIA component